MPHLPSCDTIAISGSCSSTGKTVIGKNSDRDVTESQPLIFFPAADHAEGEKLKCTYIEIDQVPHTYALIGSKPWWIWGFEHGINEWGVAIGNEADWSWIDVPDEDRLLGMDLLRLALERSRTAREGVKVITSLLEKYGQGGGCLFGRARMDFTYHNSFMVTDPNEVWLVETVDRQWIVRQIKTWQSISNVYTIEEEYDDISAGMIDFAIENGLHHKGEVFNFSKSFLLLNGTNLTGHARYLQMQKMLAAKAGKIAPTDVLSVLRNHFEGEVEQSRWSPASVCSTSTCMHGTGTIDACQTAATMIVEFLEKPYKELAFVYWGSMCPPCCSFLIPVFNTGYVPEKLGSGSNTYSEDSFWWRIMRMVSMIESNYERYHHLITDIRPAMETEFRKKTQTAIQEAEKLLQNNEREKACTLLNSVTDECLARVSAEVERITAFLAEDRKTVPGQVYRDRYYRYYTQRVKMP